MQRTNLLMYFVAFALTLSPFSSVSATDVDADSGVERVVEELGLTGPERVMVEELDVAQLRRHLERVSRLVDAENARMESVQERYEEYITDTKATLDELEEQLAENPSDKDLQEKVEQTRQRLEETERSVKSTREEQPDDRQAQIRERLIRTISEFVFGGLSSDEVERLKEAVEAAERNMDLQVALKQYRISAATDEQVRMVERAELEEHEFYQDLREHTEVIVELLPELRDIPLERHIHVKKLRMKEMHHHAKMKTKKFVHREMFDQEPDLIEKAEDILYAVATNRPQTGHTSDDLQDLAREALEGRRLQQHTNIRKILEFGLQAAEMLQSRRSFIPNFIYEERGSDLFHSTMSEAK